jgi:hypothetical protein
MICCPGRVIEPGFRIRDYEKEFDREKIALLSKSMAIA